MISSVLFPAGLFWFVPPSCPMTILKGRFAWTSDPKYSIWLTMMRCVSPLTHSLRRGHERNELTISGIPFGFGLLAIFQGSYQYLMDAYGPYAASAVCPPFHYCQLVLITARKCNTYSIWDLGISHLSLSDHVRKPRIRMGWIVRSLLLNMG
jgi:hypothetical protein